MKRMAIVGARNGMPRMENSTETIMVKDADTIIINLTALGAFLYLVAADLLFFL